MPTEIRHIVFDPAEVQSALVDYHRRRMAEMRRLSLADISIQDEPALRAFLSFIDHEGALEVVELARAELAAALILYCNQTRVPMPARAVKELKRHGAAGLCMSLWLNVPRHVGRLMARA